MAKVETKLNNVLRQFFRDRRYEDGVKYLRRSLTENSDYRESWEEVVRLIVNKEMTPGGPLKLVHNAANLPLDENTDEEAYKWLHLMLINSMGPDDSIIIEY